MFGFTKLKIILVLVSMLLLAGGFLGLRWFYIEMGKHQCETEVVNRTQEVVIENDKKLREIHANPPSADRTADRMWTNTY